MPGSPTPLALGLAWAYRILAVSAEMVLPGLLGSWLDERWGTQFLALLGFAIGITGGLFHLLLMTRRNAHELGPVRGRRDVERKSDEL